MGIKQVTLLIVCIGICIISAIPGCSTYKQLHKYHADNFEYVGRTITLDDELVAKLKAIELSYDGGKLVYEATFELVSSKYNPYAIDIIKVARLHPKMKDWDIEVELKY